MPFNLFTSLNDDFISDISVSKLNDILTSGAGGVLLLIPKDLSPESKESVQALEEYLLSTEIEVPVYFTDESEDLDYLVDNLQSVGNEKTASAAQGELTSRPFFAIITF